MPSRTSVRALMLLDQGSWLSFLGRDRRELRAAGAPTGSMHAQSSRSSSGGRLACNRLINCPFSVVSGKAMNSTEVTDVGEKKWRDTNVFSCSPCQLQLIMLRRGKRG